jgi:hypothetical protein
MYGLLLQQERSMKRYGKRDLGTRDFSYSESFAEYLDGRITDHIMKHMTVQRGSETRNSRSLSRIIKQQMIDFRRTFRNSYVSKSTNGAGGKPEPIVCESKL